MIRAILVMNDHGKPRLMKFYETKDTALQQKLLAETFRQVSRRTDYMCNFIESDGTSWEKVDSSESELGILDLIQTFVEVLDACFRNVCELDLIFNFDKIHYVLDEIVQGGMVVETRKEEILKAITEQKQLEAQEEPVAELFHSAKENIGSKLFK